MRQPILMPASAKINLSLNILAKRDDGLHEIESLVAFVALSDELTCTRAERFTSNRPPDDLINRAHAALQEAVQKKLPCALHLTKQIPTAAGLGGGSADAAATLRALSQAFSLTAPLAPLAQKLGADVAVCLERAPAFVQGTGERITRLAPLPEADIVLVNPNKPLSTADVFGVFAANTDYQMPAPPPPTFANLAELIAYIRARGNALTAPACQIVPEIKTCLARLEKCNALYAAMSGSGATCFALTEKGEGERLARAYKKLSPDDWCVATHIVAQ